MHGSTEREVLRRCFGAAWPEKVPCVVEKGAADPLSNPGATAQGIALTHHMPLGPCCCGAAAVVRVTRERKYGTKDGCTSVSGTRGTGG